MALGRKCSSLKTKRGVNGGEVGLGLGFVKSTRGLGRKRVLITNVAESLLSPESEIKNPLKRQCSLRTIDLEYDERSLFEALPQDILIRIICGVNHEDLKQLFHVSKAIREATLVAKQSHFAYSTPTKTRVFRSSIDFEEPIELEDDIDAPNAPKQQRVCRSRISGRKLADVSVALFASPKKGLFVEEE
ncbi:F-box protein At1g61340-like [Pistacia vera]|uniref:Uncharacterized protein n=1 Tax=Pistacia atlantica TaxID=434234 RepID=A0ACC1A4Q3_9ROSI|nr:F-box protein At1g61340-like [Pistacia vera]KAJ0082475.1 hypothetical protein Patl1_10886 [Pistacia atlantica]